MNLWTVAWTAIGGISAAVWLIVAILPWQPHRTRERIAAQKPRADNLCDLSAITVLIPARNEAEHIEATLDALAQQGAGLHAIVIDDRSTDATAAIAQSFCEPAAGESTALSVDVVAGKPLPSGWGGKLWALQQGLNSVDRPYCLLIDADIVLAPGMVPALLTATRHESLSLLSVMATLRCQTFWERALVPPFIFFFKLLYPFALVARVGSRVAAAAGGCILVETKLLRGVGAFSDWADALIDDCTLAGKIKADSRYAQRRMRLLLSHDVVSTRGYAQLCEFWQMVTRTAFTQLRYSFALLLLTTFAMAIAFLGPFASLLLSQSYVGVTFGAIAFIAMIADYAPVARFYGLPPLWRMALPAAGVMFLAMTWHSAINYYSGTRATWKSRQYDSHG